jgi:uncharacterized iron-regulated membrane protein
MAATAQTQTPVQMGAWETWLKHPQRFWLRKVILQVHLWTGIALSFYVLLMSVSGTVLIYRVDISKASLRPRVIVAGPGPRLTSAELKQAAQRAYPNYAITDVAKPPKPNQPVEIAFERGDKNLQRIFNPFTGADLGNAVPAGFRFIEWLADLHDNLLYEPAGRVINGIGGIAATLLCVTGAVIWWPGIGKWRRALTFTYKGDARSLNWGLHRAIGIWSAAFIIFWGISGIYLAVPEPFEAGVALIDPPAKSSRAPALGEQVLSWLARLHFGRFGGLSSKLIWTLFGIAPVVLVITGLWMWWNRAVWPRLRPLRVPNPLK